MFWMLLPFLPMHLLPLMRFPLLFLLVSVIHLIVTLRVSTVFLLPSNQLLIGMLSDTSQTYP
jgi:hypothetical protein